MIFSVALDVAVSLPASSGRSKKLPKSAPSPHTKSSHALGTDHIFVDVSSMFIILCGSLPITLEKEMNVFVIVFKRIKQNVF